MARSSLGLVVVIAAAACLLGAVSASAADPPPPVAGPENALHTPGTTDVSTTTDIELVPTKDDGSVLPQVVTTTIVAETQRISDPILTPDGTDSLVDKSGGCWIGKWTITWNSNWQDHYTWQHYVQWCGNGSKITSMTYNQGINIKTGTLWSWEGNIASRSYGVGTGVLDTFKEGKYCWNPIYPCAQAGYPNHEGHYYPNGSWSTVSGSSH